MIPWLLGLAGPVLLCVRRPFVLLDLRTLQ